MQIFKVSKDMQMSSSFGIMNCFVGNVLEFRVISVDLQENNKNFNKHWLIK